ncbi:helicase HerA domain-containing protein [Nesterenkonia marinintestina]|uniref:helicase HerA domain-containing protein n=1 Tax=Nesterenkonia marinintestina TaxID=2979865 RepID=UPI0021BEC904|nr:DUF87 domain-containing protein [Nesterenkonia sp. GX14115]
MDSSHWVVKDLQRLLHKSLTKGPRREQRSFEVHSRDRRSRRVAAKQRKALFDALEQKTKDVEAASEKLPARKWGSGGEVRARSGHGMSCLHLRGTSTTTHTAATSFPFVSGPSLGWEGVLIGRDMNGGGPLVFDPWVLYQKGVISAMSMMLFGQVGMGKSSLAKSLAIRLVLRGRKLAVASDIKGEWTPIVQGLGGAVILIGPGVENAMNPLDPGVRPSRTRNGAPMTDYKWDMVVRSRRLDILANLVKVIDGQDPTSAQHFVLAKALDTAVQRAKDEGDRPPLIPDVQDALSDLHDQESDPLRNEAANTLTMTMARMTEGDLVGMFDRETTVDFAGDAPAVSIDTSAAQESSPLALRIIKTCTHAWMEAMITHADGGKRLVVYEEGWSDMSHEAEMSRLVERFKLARAYGIFNLVIMHKVSDLDMSGQQGSRMVAMARSLLADSDVKVIYKQDQSTLKVTADDMALSERERDLLTSLEAGQGLWRIGSGTYEVYNELSAAEIPLLNTDSRIEDRGAAGERLDEETLLRDYVATESQPGSQSGMEGAA